MAKEHTPADALELAQALAARLDQIEETTLGDLLDQVGTLEGRLKETGENVHALGRGIASISNRIDLLRRPAAPEPAPADRDEVQREWLAVGDPELAFEWLVELDQWHDERYRWLAGKRLPECWPWHPRAVVELIALHEQYISAYGGDNPTAVSDFLGRWLPFAEEHLRKVLGECASGVHLDRVLGTTKVDPAELRNVAAWWALNRDDEENIPGLIPRS